MKLYTSENLEFKNFIIATDESLRSDHCVLPWSVFLYLFLSLFLCFFLFTYLFVCLFLFVYLFVYLFISKKF